MGKLLKFPSNRNSGSAPSFGKKEILRLPDYSRKIKYILSDARHALWRLRDEGFLDSVFEAS